MSLTVGPGEVEVTVPPVPAKMAELPFVHDTLVVVEAFHQSTVLVS